MATITKLYRSADEPVVTMTGSSTSCSVNWILQTDANVRTVAANALLKALQFSNSFDFTVVGSLDPDDNSLQSIGWSVVQLETSRTYTKFMVTTQLTNSKPEIDANVNPAQAQDSYSFDSSDYEVIVSETQGDSKATASPTLKGAVKGNAIQNTAQRGIITTETEKIQEVTIVRNEESFSIKEVAEHLGRVNSQKVTLVGETFKAGQCKLDRWSASDAYDSEGKLYYRVTYKISVAEEEDFFEKRFIMRGALDKNGDAPPAALGLTADTDYKLQEDGTFFSKADQADPTKFFSVSFVTKKSSNWGSAVRLESIPNSSLINLSNQTNIFGLQPPSGVSGIANFGPR